MPLTLVMTTSLFKLSKSGEIRHKMQRLNLFTFATLELLLLRTLLSFIWLGKIPLLHYRPAPPQAL
jgi:hypothetical protein